MPSVTISRWSSARLPAAYISTPPSRAYSGSSAPKQNIASWVSWTACGQEGARRHAGEGAEDALGWAGELLPLLERQRFHCPAPQRFQRPGWNRVAEQPLPQLRSQLDQLPLLPPAEALVDHLLDPADDRPHQLPRQAFALGHLGQHPHRQLRRLVHRAVDQRRALYPGGINLDDAHLGRCGLGD